jgi:hypothetical protein
MSRTDLIEYTYAYRRKGQYQHIKKNVEGAAGDWLVRLVSQNFGLYPVCIGRHSSVHARFVFLCAAYAYRKKERM